jgi:hypothetical protein
MTALAPDPGEVWAGLVDAWRSDEAVAALLGAPNAVYRGYPALPPKLPCLIVEWVSLNPKRSTGFGIFNPVLQISVYSRDQDLGGRLFAQLQENWQIPTQRTVALLTDHYRLTQLLLSEPRLIGPFRSDEYGDGIWHAVMEARTKVERIAA